MLVLSRKVNDEIVIGKNVTIKVVKVIGNRVRLGISAPESINIRRGEVVPAIIESFDVPLDQFVSANVQAVQEFSGRSPGRLFSIQDKP